MIDELRQIIAEVTEVEDIPGKRQIGIEDVTFLRRRGLDVLVRKVVTLNSALRSGRVHS